MKRVNIVTWNNGVGLTRSIGILSDLLEGAGFRVEVNGPGPPSFREELYLTAHQRTRFRPVFHINLFVQYVVPQWFNYARFNCVIPNQEWFEDEWLAYLNRLDMILCKTKHAQDIFNKLGCRTEFTSFTSVDRFDPAAARNYDRFFHLAGRSTQKGTDRLIEMWLKHAEWPTLKIVQYPENAKPVSASNLEFVAEYLNDDVLREWQNSHGVHLCPSEVEGFGHYMVEAMSCKALTIATDAPPMNEIVSSSRGVLVGHRGAEVQRLGLSYLFDSADLEQKMDDVLGMELPAKKRLGEAARDWYEDNDRFFRRRFIEVLQNL